MGAQNYPDTTSRNAIAEVEGLEWPEETVLVSGHLDSWDVGMGVMDDASGCMISLLSGLVLQRMGLRPRRTLRTVLFTDEEQSQSGGQVRT